MYNDMKILDAHVHYALPVEPEELLAAMDATNTDMANLVVVPHRQRVSSVPEALVVKDMYPGRFYVYGSLDVSAYFRWSKTLGKHMAKHAQRMLRCGCDGIKMIEGKPQLRKMLPIPDFDEPCWEPFFAWAEEAQLPILWHVNDPETFWDEKTIPSWAKERGWLYGEGFVNNEAQYSQVLNVLARHPKLKIIFAHFFFMSAQLPRLSELLDSYPNIMVDLTPGIEMYESFSASREQSREFFIRYADRIVYGTDIGARAVLAENGDATLNNGESLSRSTLVREFLITGRELTVKADGNFLIGTQDFTLHGLALSREIVEKILCENFIHFTGKEPRPVSRKDALADCRRVKRTIRMMALFDKDLKPDTSCAERAAEYFKKR